MTSPGTDVCGSSLPSTAHSISRAFGTAASTTILRSNDAGKRPSLHAVPPASSPSRCRHSIPGLPASRTSGIPAALRAQRRSRRLAAPSRAAGRRDSRRPEGRAPRRRPSSLPCPSPDRRGGDASADVRHVGELEQALYRAVLAVWAVQDREDDVEMETGDRRLGRLRRSPAAPLDRKDGLLARP